MVEDPSVHKTAWSPKMDPHGIAEWNQNAYHLALRQNNMDPVCFFQKEADMFVQTYLDEFAGKAGDLANVGKHGHCHTPRNKQAMRLDLGHHINNGLVDALMRAIVPERLAFIRIRRSREKTAVSHFVSGNIPCGSKASSTNKSAPLGKGMFILCPWEHGSVLLASDPEASSKWDKLNSFQKVSKHKRDGLTIRPCLWEKLGHTHSMMCCWF